MKKLCRIFYLNKNQSQSDLTDQGDYFLLFGVLYIEDLNVAIDSRVIKCCARNYGE